MWKSFWLILLRYIFSIQNSASFFINIDTEKDDAEETLKIHWRYTEESLKIHWRYTEDTLKLHWRYTKDYIRYTEDTNSLTALEFSN